MVPKVGVWVEDTVWRNWEVWKLKKGGKRKKKKTNKQQDHKGAETVIWYGTMHVIVDFKVVLLLHE